MGKRKRIIHNIYTVTPSKGEVSKGTSVTVPGESYTIQELFQRSQSGIDLPVRNQYYGDDSSLDDHDLEKINSLDLVEQEIALQQASQVIEKAKQKKEPATQKAEAGENDAQPKEGAISEGSALDEPKEKPKN